MTVVLVTPRGAVPDGVTDERLVATVNGPVADFWSQQTGGAIRLGVTGVARLGHHRRRLLDARPRCGTRPPPRRTSCRVPASTCWST